MSVGLLVLAGSGVVLCGGYFTAGVLFFWHGGWRVGAKSPDE